MLRLMQVASASKEGCHCCLAPGHQQFSSSICRAMHTALCCLPAILHVCRHTAVTITFQWFASQIQKQLQAEQQPAWWRVAWPKPKQLRSTGHRLNALVACLQGHQQPL